MPTGLRLTCSTGAAVVVKATVRKDMNTEVRMA